MNVFILNTGRCGSSAFIKACSHITNYSSAHESKNGLLQKSRFNYPKNHIEADNRLSWQLGKLDEAYGNDAIYVHLKRSTKDTARSFARRYSHGIIKAFYITLISNNQPKIIKRMSKQNEPIDVAIDYCDTVNSNIKFFLKDKKHKILINIENIDKDFMLFWKLIDAKGNINDALDEFNIKHNSYKHQSFFNKIKWWILNNYLKLKKAILNLPNLKNS